MATALKLELGEIEETSLKFENGLEVDGRYGPQVMFTVKHESGERALYVPPLVADNIYGLKLRKGERLQIVKRAKNEGRKKGVEYVVARVDRPQDPAPARVPIQAAAPAGPIPVPPTTALEAQLKASIQQTSTNTPSQSSVAARPSQATEVPPANILSDFIVYNTTVLTGILCASIDALQNAERYAASKGFKLEFNEEDVRTMANTLYIQSAKGAQQQWR